MSDKTASGNVGEWSEVYVLFHLLGCHTIYPCDQKLVKKGYGYPVLEIIRGDNNNQEHHFIFKVETCTWHGQTLNIEINPHECTEEALKLLEDIHEATKRKAKVRTTTTTTTNKKKKKELEFPEAHKYLRSLGVNNLKANQKDKQDITLKISDIHSGTNPICGFSIKSFLGKPPTLFNATKGDARDNRKGASCFIYEVKMPRPLTQTQVDNLNKNKAEHLVREIYKNGGYLKYIENSIEGSCFRSNLRYIDSLMPKYLAEISIFYRLHDIPSVEEATSRFAEEDIFGYKNSSWYKYKMQKLLEASAFGMTAGTPWEGEETANGGFIIVKPNGDVVTYHIYNRKELLEYLYQGTKFDHASQSKKKNDYGYIYFDKSRKTWCLCLQVKIRYIKKMS